MQFKILINILFCFIKHFIIHVHVYSFTLRTNHAIRVTYFCFIIPHSMSCGGYNLFTHPSVHQSVIHSVCPGFFLSGECNSSETAQQNFIKLCSYEGHNACVDVIFSPFFTWELYPFELKIWKKLKNLTNWNRLSAQLLWNEQLELNLAKICYFLQLMWNRFSMNDREAVQSDNFLTANFPMLHKCDNYL